MDAQSQDSYANPAILAFTGMSGIFPGSPDVDAFWQRIVHAEVAPLACLEERWKVPHSAYFDPQPGRPDRVYLDRAFCLPESDSVGGGQIACACKAVGSLLEGLKRTGALPDLSEVGLVLGTSWSDQGYFYQDIDYFFGRKERNLDAVLERFSPDEQINAIQAHNSIGGPGLAVDAACASSIYAVELAADLIRSNQARAVIVLGLSVGLPLFLMAAFSQLMALAANGKSLPFSEAACGMVPAEGVGAVLLEPMEDALRAGRKVFGILRAVGLSSDGAEGSVFAPSLEGQRLAYQRAYQGMASPDVDYIEAHGTATMLGDETEMSSIEAFFGPHQEKNRKIPVGSVKALIGHGLAAAGMASLIKSLLMFREDTIPPHIPVSPHPRVESSCISLPSKACPLPQKDRPHRIGISSFGFGGSNAHLVVDAYDPGPTERHFAGRPIGRGPARLAIVDLEAAFGNAVGATEALKALHEERVSPFPGGRFSQSWGDQMHGLFFPDELEIGTKGLRLGPKLLSRVDPLQNLASYLVGLLVRRHETIKDSDDTAAVLCSNMGGGKSHQLARRHFLRYYGPTTTKGRIRETSVEELASGLGSMLSGYPALHFDFRAFHHTLSGDIGLFWTTILTAPFLLSQHCRHLIVGGGNYFKTPLDFCHRNIRTCLGTCSLLEGFAVFLLKDLETAEMDGDRILAEVRGMVTGKEAKNFDEACQVAGIDPASVDLRESCQLEPGFRSKVEGRPAERGAWFFGEASGVDALASALLKEGRLASVEVCSGEDLLLVLFLSKRDRLSRTTAAVEVPLMLSFQDPCLSQSDTGPENETKETRPVQSLRKAERGQQAAEGEPRAADRMVLWHTSTADVLIKYLGLQRKIIEAIPAGKETRRSLNTGERVLEIEDSVRRSGRMLPKRKKENQVLREICCQQEQKRYSADLVVDETHSYFFDHPLDHVPGLLLIEGLVQLLQVTAPDMGIETSDRGVFVREIDVLFTKWCEKDCPVLLRLEKRGGSPEQGCSFVGKVEQGGEIVSKVVLRADGFRDERLGGDAPVPPTVARSSKHAFLHKQRPENVVVSELEREGDRFFVEALPPPPNHILADGDPDFYSCVYLLEASRQCGLMITHALGEVPLDLSMILLYVRMILDRPALRKERLTVGFVPEARSPFSPNTIGSMDLRLSAKDGELGRISIHALIADAEEYRRQRWSRGESNA